MTSQVLIVEDEAIIAMDIERSLRRMGHDVIARVATGEAAIEHAPRADLVLMDVRLASAMDGIEAAARIREAGGPPVLFLSGSSDRGTLDRAIGSSPLGFLLKPFDDHTLEVGVRMALYVRDCELQLQAHAEALERIVDERTSALRSRERELEIATGARKDFLINMNHELKTPLHAVIGFAELIANYDGKVSAARRVEWANAAADAGKRLLGLINDMLDLAALELDSMTLEATDIDAGELLRAAASVVESAATRKGLGLTVAVEGEGPLMVHADAGKITHALVHLLSNAIRFTDAGSIELSASRQDDRVRIEVRDRGPGIAAEEIARLLEPFSRGDSALSAAHQGAGVGLPLVRRLVELHGQTLCIDSEVGAGTRVHFTLPAA